MFSFSLLQVRASNGPVLEIDNAPSLVEKITSDNYALFLTFATIFDSWWLCHGMEATPGDNV